MIRDGELPDLNQARLQNDLKFMFQVSIAHSDSLKEWFAQVYSATDEKAKIVRSTSFNLLMKDIRKAIGSKEREIRNFPMPEPVEPSRIISLNGD